MVRRFLALSLALGLSMALTACKEEAPLAPPPMPAPPAAPPAPAPTPAAAPAAAAPAGPTSAVKGMVTLKGKPPEMKALDRKADPFCAKTPMKDEEVLAGKDGSLANVVVRLTKGVTGTFDAPKEDATVNQEACMYRPRVQAVMAGQNILIKNGDQTLHNVHTYKGATTLFNQAQVPGLAPIAKKFNDAGDVIKFKCDVHPWMTGYVAVHNHPFFAVTKEDGSFTLDKVPAGTYTVEAWHEKLGTKTAEVTVAADKPAEAKFEF